MACSGGPEAGVAEATEPRARRTQGRDVSDGVLKVGTTLQKRKKQLLAKRDRVNPASISDDVRGCLPLQVATERLQQQGSILGAGWPMQKPSNQQ